MREPELPQFFPLADGRYGNLMPLTLGRVRLCRSASPDDPGYEDAW